VRSSGEGAGFEFEGAEVVAVDEAGGEVEAEEVAEAAEAFGLSGVGGFVAEEGEVVGDVVAEEDGVVEGHACGEAAVEAEGGGEALLPCEAGHGDGGTERMRMCSGCWTPDWAAAADSRGVRGRPWRRASWEVRRAHELTHGRERRTRVFARRRCKAGGGGVGGA